MKKKLRYILSALLLSTFLAGCSQNTVKPVIADANLIEVNHATAEILTSSASLSTTQAVLITSFVDIDNLKQSSTFGRITAEQVGSKLSQLGYPVIEMKLRSNIFIKELSGEFILSRELKSLSTLHDAQAVLVGTYAVASESVYVTSKLIRTTDGVILSSHDYVIPMGKDTKALLK